MAWLVIARVDGLGEPRIVADTSWKGWPKVKDFAGNLVPEHRMAGKDVVHVIGESDDGKTISPALRSAPKADRPLVVPKEAQEIIARKVAPPLVQEIGPDGMVEQQETPEPVEVTERPTSPVAAPKKEPKAKKEVVAKRAYNKKKPVEA